MSQVTCSRCNTVPPKGQCLFVTMDSERLCDGCLAAQIAGMKWPRPSEFAILQWLSANVIGVQQDPA